jgi:hypothetical protein
MHGILFFRPTNIAAWESGYCAINVAPGSLVYQVKGDIALTKTLIPDLRGCSVRTQFDAETQATYLNVVTASSGLGFQLRPPVPETFDSWLAALLCWQPLRPKGIQNLKTAKAQLSTVEERSRVPHRQFSDSTIQPSTIVIKVGQMLLWQTSKPPPFSLRDTHAHHPANQDHFWRRVNCTLKENGYFQLLAESDSTLTSLIRLPLLFRNAVQHLDSSVLGEDYCIAIYPEYHVQHHSKLPQQPVFLALNSREHFEAWFVLLRAFTVPELYGPDPEGVEDPSSPLEEERSGTSSGKINIDGLFRVERTLSIKIVEARIKPAIHGEFYSEVLLDRHVRARSSTKKHTSSVFWAEEFLFNDLPSVVSNACILIKGGNLAEREWTMVAHGPWDISQTADPIAPSTDIEVMSHDTVHGKLEIQLDSLEQDRKAEKWWPLIDHNHRVVGDVLLKIQLDETVVLMQEEYSSLSKLLHKFDNGITTQIAQVLQSDLKQLSDVFLDIFQVTDSVIDWMIGLVDEEIDGIYRDSQPTRMRFSNRLHSNDSYESAENREVLVRDLSRTATMEANLLFRGNSILTKTLDAYMRRLGNDYLRNTIAAIIRAIVESDPDCEIDPARVRSQDQLEANQENLMALTRSIWQAIIASASSCPHKLRLIFRHIRSCAEDRYGSFIRTVGYTSVSGFLFLRLFCPALLNPKLFGLLDGMYRLFPDLGCMTDRVSPDIPPERARRTLTLIAKTLIGLANMQKFGSKEAWMEPMNRFLLTATPEFRTFIDQICSVSTSSTNNHINPQYATPIQILERLPATSREGALSLPYLLDSAKLFAQVVNLWASSCPPNFVETGVDESVRAFHEICMTLYDRTQECLETAEQAGRPEQDLQPKWERLLVEQPSMLNVRESVEQVASPIEDDEVTALPQTQMRHVSSRSVSGANSYFPLIPTMQRSPVLSDKDSFADRRTDQRVKPRSTATTSNNSSTISFDGSDEQHTRSAPSSREGPGKARFKWKGPGNLPVRRKPPQEE